MASSFEDGDGHHRPSEGEGEGLGAALALSQKCRIVCIGLVFMRLLLQRQEYEPRAQPPAVSRPQRILAERAPPLSSVGHAPLAWSGLVRHIRRNNQHLLSNGDDGMTGAFESLPGIPPHCSKQGTNTVVQTRC